MVRKAITLMVRDDRMEDVERELDELHVVVEQRDTLLGALFVTADEALLASMMQLPGVESAEIDHGVQLPPMGEAIPQ